MKKRIEWHQHEDQCEMFNRFIEQHFSEHSLKEILYGCIDLKYGNPKVFKKLLLSMGYSIEKCPESIIASFQKIEQVPLYYNGEHLDYVVLVKLLFARILEFLNADANYPQLATTEKRTKVPRNIVKRNVDEFICSIELEFNGKLGI
jgi:hypothetical protein